MKRFLIRITLGQYLGRYVSYPFAGGPVTPEMLENLPVDIHGTAFGLRVNENTAIRFIKQAAQEVQGKLRAQGYETELIESLSPE
jgi:hypothetical protein